MRKGLANGLMALAATAAAFAFLEVGLRLRSRGELALNDPYQLTRLTGTRRYRTPFHSYREVYPLQFDHDGYYAHSAGAIDYNFDQSGGRWLEPQPRNLDGDVALVVGDSFTLGFGLRYQDAYVYKLEEALRQQGRRRHFVNFAEPGANSRISLRNYLAVRDQQPHDLLLYGLHINDLIKFPTSLVAMAGAHRNAVAKSRALGFVAQRLVRYRDRNARIAELTDPAQLEQPLFREIRRFAAPEAHQAVAVDAGAFYAIADREIAKYDKHSGARISHWYSPVGGPIHHLNSGIVIDGRLYCAHSNYPHRPMTSSIEVFDTASLHHVGRHSFGVSDGSATWVDRYDGRWWVGFAHYDGHGGEPGKGSDATGLVAFDDQWRRLASYRFPAEVVRRFRPYSNSGGAWDMDGRLHATGHSASEIYVLRLPGVGSELELVEIVATPMAGQGIAWDPSEPGTLFGIIKASHAVIVARRDAGT